MDNFSRVNTEKMQSSVMYQALKGELKSIPLTKGSITECSPSGAQMVLVPKHMVISSLKPKQKSKASTSNTDIMPSKTTFVRNIFDMRESDPLSLNPGAIETTQLNDMKSRVVMEFKKSDLNHKSVHSTGNQRVPYTSTTLEKELSRESLRGADCDKDLRQHGKTKKSNRLQKKRANVHEEVIKIKNGKYSRNRNKEPVKQRLEEKTVQVRLSKQSKSQDYENSHIDNIIKKNCGKSRASEERVMSSLSLIRSKQSVDVNNKKHRHPSAPIKSPSEIRTRRIKISRTSSADESSSTDDEIQENSSAEMNGECNRDTDEIKRKTIELGNRFKYNDMFKLSVPKIQYIPAINVKHHQGNHLTNIEAKMRFDHLQESARRIESLVPKWSSILITHKDQVESGRMRNTLASARVILDSRVSMAKKMLKRSLCNSQMTPEEKEKVEYYTRQVELDIESLERQFDSHERNLEENLDNPGLHNS